MATRKVMRKLLQIITAAKLPALTTDCGEGAVVDASVDKKICQIKMKHFAVSLEYFYVVGERLITWKKDLSQLKVVRKSCEITDCRVIIIYINRSVLLTNAYTKSNCKRKTSNFSLQWTKISTRIILSISQSVFHCFK